MSMYSQTGKIKDINIPGEFIREGLTAVINVKVPEPEFEGQTKTRLGNPEVRQIVDGIVSDMLQTLFEWNPAIFTAICNKALAAQTASIAAKAARELVSIVYMIALMMMMVTTMMVTTMMVMMMMMMIEG